MINKLYEKIKQLIKQNKNSLIILLLVFVLFSVRLPYYINTGGGILNLNKRVEVSDSNESNGSFNLTYVSELDGKLPFVLFSFLNPNWDLIKSNEIVSSNETYEDLNYRNKMLLNEANTNALLVAFTKTNKKINITNEELYITYVDELSKTDLKIGDQILMIDGEVYSSKDELKKYILSKNVGDVIKFKVLNNDKEYNRRATIFEHKKASIIGVLLTEKLEYETNPDVKFKFKKSESGPSAGLMTTLEIYNSLISEDITKGYKIAGTGTIDSNGEVGEISGVEYKLKAAAKDKADIFLVPMGDNYKEAIKVKKEKKYSIDIVGVETFDEALNYLESK